MHHILDKLDAYEVAKRYKIPNSIDTLGKNFTIILNSKRGKIFIEFFFTG